MGAIRSMTGFSSGSFQYNGSEISCEIRSVNSRYLEINLKTPRILAEVEDSLKEIVRQKISRGKITVILSFSSVTPSLENLKVDSSTVVLYKNLLEQIRKIAQIEQPVQLEHLLEFKDILSFEEEFSFEEGFIKALEELLNTCLDALNENRSREGANLKQDVVQRLENINRVLSEIEKLAKDNARVEFEKLYTRLLNMIEEKSIDRNRLELELALISDRVDITEEIIRLKSHLQLFLSNLNAGSPIGKKMNFILQEMHREANTISSKNTMIEISHRIVQIKEEIERIREQVQNIE